MRRRFDLMRAILVSAAVHAAVLLLMDSVVVSVAQPHKTDHPRLGTVVPLEEPPESKHPPVQMVVQLTDGGPYVEDVAASRILHGPSHIQEYGSQREPSPISARLLSAERADLETDKRPVDQDEDFLEEFEDETCDIDAPGQEYAISDIPLDGTGVNANVGVGGGRSGVFGRPEDGSTGPLQAGRDEAASAASEDHLAAALRWLAENQEADGSWLVTKHGGSMTDEFSVALTGLATLALLGKGNTATTGRYSAHVRRALGFLADHQDAEGQIGVNSGAETGGGYNHAIAGLALAEARRLGASRKVREAAQRAVDWSCGRHQAVYSGWGHSPGSAECDTSVTAWFVLQLTTALRARLRVPGRSFQGAVNWLQSVESLAEDDTGDGTVERGGLFAFSPGRESTPESTALGMRCMVAIGWHPFELAAGAELVAWALPTWETRNFNYWCHACATGTEPGWNRALMDVLKNRQRRGGPKDGSWDPDGDPWGERAGRVFTTALGALCLEVERRQAVGEWYARRTEHVLEWRLRRMYLHSLQLGRVGEEAE